MGRGPSSTSSTGTLACGQGWCIILCMRHRQECLCYLLDFTPSPPKGERAIVNDYVGEETSLCPMQSSVYSRIGGRYPKRFDSSW